MKYFFFVTTLLCLFFSGNNMLRGQCNILFIDQGNGLTSEIVPTFMNGRIFNTLTAAGHTVTRSLPTWPIPGSLPAAIDPDEYDQVWIFGIWGGENGINPQNVNALLNIVNPYLAAGGAVYVASENLGTNRFLIQTLMNTHVINGASVDYIGRHINSGRFLASTVAGRELCGVVQPELEFRSSAVAEFKNVPPENVFLEVDGSCGGDPVPTVGEVVGVHFGACDMVAGKGALMAIGDMNIFVDRPSCFSSSLWGSGSANTDLINRVSNTLASTKVCLEDPLALTDITVCAGERIPTYVFEDSLPGKDLKWTNSEPLIGAPTAGDDSLTTFIATNNTSNPLVAEITVSVPPSACDCPIPDQIFYITVQPNLVVDAGRDTLICAGSPVKIGGAPTASGGLAPHTYSWSPLTSLDDGTIANPSVSPSAVAITEYTIIVTDAFGCEAEADLFVSNNTDAAIDPPGGPFCENEPPFDLTAANLGGVWSGTGITDLAVGTFDASVAGPGTHTITYTIPGVCISVGTVDIEIQAIDNPVITAVGPFCETDAGVSLSASIAAGTWQGTGITDPVNGDFDPALAGVGVHTITYTTNGLCPDDTTIDIEILDIPALSFTSNIASSCLVPGSVFEFTNTSLGVFTGTFTWDFGDGNTATGDVVSHGYDNAGAYNVSLTYSNGTCELSSTETEFVTVYRNPVAGFKALNNPLSIYNTTMAFNDVSVKDIVVWSWNFSDLGSSTEQNPSFVFPEIPGKYPVELQVTDQNNCKDSITGIIEVESDVVLFVPNTFTPDGDQLNQVFKPIFNSVIDDFSYHLQIFNRWGEILFESFNKDVGWDGTYGAQGQVQDGVFVWKITYKEFDSTKIQERTGHITVLK